MGRRVCTAFLLAALALPAARVEAGELLFFAEGNRLHRLAIASIDAPPRVGEVLIPSSKDDPVNGRDINGMICPVPGGGGRFIASEDTGQPDTPGGWALLSPDGRQLGKLTPPARSQLTEPFGCAFDAEGRLFTSEVGDPGFLPRNGQLLQWLPPFDRFPGPPGAYPDTAARSDGFCALATDIGTAGGVAVDPQGRVYVSSSNRGAIYRFSPPFADRPEDCERVGVRRETFVRALATFSGLAMSPHGTLYAASVLFGRIYEYDLDGNRLRTVLRSPGSTLPPHAYGTPQGLAVDSRGTLYYADLDLAPKGRFGIDTGPNGKIWRVRFVNGEPQDPEILVQGLAFPDGLGVLPR